MIKQPRRHWLERIFLRSELELHADEVSFNTIISAQRGWSELKVTFSGSARQNLWRLITHDSRKLCYIHCWESFLLGTEFKIVDASCVEDLGGCAKAFPFSWSYDKIPSRALHIHDCCVGLFNCQVVVTVGIFNGHPLQVEQIGPDYVVNGSPSIPEVVDTRSI